MYKVAILSHLTFTIEIQVSVDGTAAKYKEQTLSTNLVAYRAGSTTVVMCSPTSPFFSWLSSRFSTVKSLR